MNYQNLFTTEWHDSKPRPSFETPVYFFGYDGTNYAYENEGDVWSFLSWVVGVIHQTTEEWQDDDEPDDEFLDRAGVTYGIWGVGDE